MPDTTVLSESEVLMRSDFLLIIFIPLLIFFTIGTIFYQIIIQAIHKEQTKNEKST